MERRSQWGWWMLGMALLLAAVGLIAAQPPAADAGAGIQLISRGLGGSPAAGDSRGVDLSGDGRYLVFESDAADLVPGDGNQATDIFLWDAQGGGISRLSAAPGGGDADGASHTPVISADGRFAAFESQATNLIGSDVNGVTSDIFLADRQTGAISLVTQSTGGVQANSSSFTPAISADGRYVAFASLARNLVISDTNLFIDIYVRDTVSNTLELVTRGLNGAMTDESSFTPAISADGRYVVYSSGASNLVPGDTNGVTDIFSYDRQTGETVRLSMGLNGAEANENSYLPDISGDGRFVGYTSLATNLVLSDTNDAFDVFLFDRQTGQTERLSVTAQGDEANGNSVAVRLSFDGQYATYASDAANLAGGDNNGQMDIFWLDRGMGELQLVSRSVMGDAGNGQSVLSQLSNDGNMLAFESVASDLVGDDGNGSQDIFYTVVESMPPTPTPSPTATATVPVDLPQFLPLVRAGYPPSYEISGFVRTAAGQPVANVRVTTGAGRVAQTDASGAYRFQWLPAGSYTLTPARAGYSFSPASRIVTLPPAAGGVDFVATLLTTPTPTPMPSATPSPTSAPPTDTPTPVVCTELLANGGFEQVGAWVIEVNAYPAGYETAVVHSGSWAARIGIVNPADNQFSYSSIWQTVSVPAGVDQATLTFWLHTLSSGARWGPPANFDLDGLDLALLTDDAQYVLVYDQANQQHTLVFQRVNAGAWQAFQFDLTGFAGQTIRLYFGVFNNGSGGVTGMYLDDVSLRVCQE